MTEMTTGELVANLARNLNYARMELAGADENLKKLERELKERRESDSRYTRAKNVAERVETFEIALRDAILEHYKATGQKKVEGVGGVDVAVRKKYEISDEKLAMEWAIQNTPITVKVSSTPTIQGFNKVMEALPEGLASDLWSVTDISLDEKGLTKMFKGNPPDDIPPFIAVTEEPGARIFKEIDVEMFVSRTGGERSFMDEVMGDWPSGVKQEEQDHDLPF